MSFSSVTPRSLAARAGNGAVSGYCCQASAYWRAVSLGDRLVTARTDAAKRALEPLVVGRPELQGRSEQVPDVVLDVLQPRPVAPHTAQHRLDPAIRAGRGRVRRDVVRGRVLPVPGVEID